MEVGIGITIIMPVLPRNRNTQDYPERKMDSQIFTQETMGLVHEIKVNELYLRPDLEIKKIINNESEPMSKIIIGGISAGANMANRYSILHPANIIGVVLMLAGDFVYPVTTLGTIELHYPFGINGINELRDTNLDIDLFKQIPHMLCVGEFDTNPENDPLPFELNNNKEDIIKYQQLLGLTPTERTMHYHKFLKSFGMSNEIVVGKNMGHEINKELTTKVRDWLQDIIQES